MPAYMQGNSQVVHFGHGDICFSIAHSSRVGGEEVMDEVAFIVHEHQHEIGAVTNEYDGKSTDELNCPVRFIFDNVESLDALMLTLSELRGKLAPPPAWNGNRHPNGYTNTCGDRSTR